MLCLLLAACGSGRPVGSMTGYYPQGKLTEPVSCVPYARARSGIMVSGDAWEWWEEAPAFAYARGHVPQAGSVLVIDRSRRLRSGHVSVVTRVLSRREILVDHANWASGSAKGRIEQNQRVVDVSSRNDWSLVRVWYPPIEALGNTSYPALGFVYPSAAGGTVASR